MSRSSRDHRGRYSQDGSRHRSRENGPFDVDGDNYSDDDEVVYYRNQFVEHDPEEPPRIRPAPVRPPAPTLVVDMIHSVDEDAAMARMIQDEIDAEFQREQALRRQQRQPPYVPPPPPRPTAPPQPRYDISPVETTQLPYSKRNSTGGSRSGSVGNSSRHTRSSSSNGGGGGNTYNHKGTNNYSQTNYNRDPNAYNKHYPRTGASNYNNTSNRQIQSNPARDASRRLEADNYDDARLARHLQDAEMAEQLRQEEEERNRRRAARQIRASTANRAAVPTPPSSLPHGRGTSSSSRGLGALSVSPIPPPPPPRRSTYSADKISPTTSTTSSESSNERAARKIAQEMDDADMARRLAEYEQEVALREAQEQAPERYNNLCFYRLFPIFILAAGLVVALLFIFGVFNADDVKTGITGIFDGKNDWVDPFANSNVHGGGDGTNAGPTGIPPDQVAWATSGAGGLELEILNAMEDRWSGALSVAVENWDKGYPIDSLSLTISTVAYDPTCEPEIGYIKVCNADYGATKWRGLNDISFNSRTNEIVKSAAKMNEYYLSQESDDQKLYTLCHEIGHGFGLPHWDEDFFNRDMGNCMDYTNNPGSNKMPSVSNFNFLSQIYGGYNTTSGERVTAAMVIAASAGENVFSGTDGTEDNNQRMLRSSSAAQVGHEQLQGHRKLESRVVFVEEQEKLRPRRVLYATEHFEVHHVDHDDHDAGLTDHVHMQFYLMVED